MSVRVIAISIGIYAIYLPVAMFVHRDWVPPPRPPGDAIEMLRVFELDKPDRYVARSYVFRTATFPDTSHISVYENLTPLPRESLTFTPDLGIYIIRFKASDGSDPRTNGRQYWAVGALVDRAPRSNRLDQPVAAIRGRPA